MTTTITPSTCCYCGVGCGVLIESQQINGEQKITGVQGDPSHPANYGRLCTKGRNLALTVKNETGRLLMPQMRRSKQESRQETDWDTALDAVAECFAAIIREHGPDSVGFYLSGQLLTEDYYVFNKIAKGLIGTNNIDTNSRLCMSSAVVAYKKALGADGPPGCYEDLELADCVVFAGSNMAYAHPVLFRRLEAAKAARGQKWIVIDPRVTDTAAMADLHLQIQPGTDVALFNAMLHHIIWQGWVDADYVQQHTEGFDALKDLVRDYSPRTVAEICGVSAEHIMQAATWFAQSPATLSLYCMGLNQSSQGTNKNLALIHLHLATRQIGRAGAGPFSLTGQPNAMGGREVGGMATMLAAHRDYQNAEHRQAVATFWQVPPERVSDRPGLPAVAMFDAVRSGKIKALYIACTNPAHSMPNLAAVHEALEKAELVVVQDCFANVDTMAYADVALPATGWGEKEGTVTNSERRISRVRAAQPARGQARSDWQIARDFGRRLQTRLQADATAATAVPAAASTPALFAWESSAEIFAEHAALTQGMDLDMTGISHARLEAQGPLQWPLPAANGQDDTINLIAAQAYFSAEIDKNTQNSESHSALDAHHRRYTDGVYARANGKAKFHLTPYEPVAEGTNARYPFHLLTGRLRDQWHGMSRTGRVATLFQHAPQPYLTMHPKDAAVRGFIDGQLLLISSKRGRVVLPLQCGEDVVQGSVFAAMHWNAQFLNSAGINETTGDAVCEQSFQPELKHSAVRVEAAQLPWRCTLAVRTDDVLEAQLRLQPLLAECGYASLSFVSDGVILLRAAHAEVNAIWLQNVMQWADLPAGVDALNYDDPRRGIFKRVLWQTHGDGGSALRGFAFAGDVNSKDLAAAETLLTQLVENAPWQGARMAAFKPDLANSKPVDKVICNCKQVRQSQIVLLHQAGKSFEAIKGELGCGTVCGSCVPEIKMLCR